ncbi:MAG: hypothetical protein J4472_02575 [DPANN group archaeon]|nr:hypothetical protein [DPANN group archaeon]
MAQTPQPTAPDYTKYDGLVSILNKDQEIIPGLETKLIEAFGNHQGNVKEGSMQGDGLIKILYDTTEKEILTIYMGGKKPEDPVQKRIIDKTLRDIIGYSPTDERFNSKKKVEFQEVKGLIEKTKDNFAGFIQADFQTSVEGLSDLEELKGYIMAKAKLLGINIKEEEMPKLSVARAYFVNVIAPSLAQLNHGAELVNKRLEAMRNAYK